MLSNNAQTNFDVFTPISAHSDIAARSSSSVAGMFCSDDDALADDRKDHRTTNKPNSRANSRQLWPSGLIQIQH